MRLNVLDGQGDSQTILVLGQEAPVDRSGTITEPGTAQELMAANAERSGWFFQNQGVVPMYLNELGEDAVAGTAWVVQPGAVFPPPGFPLTVTAISVRADNSTFTDAVDAVDAPYVAREW